MVPPTCGADLDEVAAMIPGPVREASELGLGADAAAAAGQARAEDETDVAQGPPVADRTGRPRSHRAVDRDPHQLALGVADLLAVEFALPISAEATPAVEPVVDRPGRVGGDAGSLRVAELHGLRVAIRPRHSGSRDCGPRTDGRRHTIDISIR